MKLKPRLGYLQKSTLLLLIFCFLVVLMIRVRLTTIYTYNVGGIEQNVIYGCQRVAAGLPLYNDPEKPPYSITQYSPLYFYVIGYTGKLLGLSPAEPFPWFALSRSFSLIFNLLLIVFFFRFLLNQPSIPRIFSFSLPLLLFVFFEQQDYSRPDSLYHLFLGLSVFSFWKVMNQDVPRWKATGYWASGLFTALAVFSKQSGIFLLFYLLVFLLIIKPLRKGLPWCLISFTIALALLSWVFIHTSPLVLYKNVFLGILNGLDLKWAIKLYLLPSLPRFILFFLIFSFLLFNHQRFKNAGTLFLMWGAYFYFLIALVCGLKYGSGTNYFFEFCFFTTLCIPFLYQQISEEIVPSLGPKIVMALVFAMVIPQLLIIAWRDFYKNEKEGYLKEREIAQQIRRWEDQQHPYHVIVLDRIWLNNFFYDVSLFPQPDIYTTKWNIDPGLSGLRPQPVNPGEPIYVVQQGEYGVPSIFGQDLPGLQVIGLYPPYRILGPEREQK